MKKISTSEELKVFWNHFQTDYTNFMEYNVLNLFTMLFNSSNILRSKNNNKKYILEAACGSGAGLNYLCNQLHYKNIEADVFGTDISSSMLNETYHKLKNNPFINLHYLDSRYEKIDNNSKINLYLKESDNENLSFEDNKFDLIISSLSLHLVSNPDKMINEFKRIVKEDGYSLYSIWGKPENCLPFTILPNTLKKYNVVLPNSRSNFHLSNEDTLKTLIFNAGIKKYKISTTFIPFDFTEGKEFLFIFNGPSNKEMTKNCSEEELEMIKRDFVEKLDEEINSDRFFGIEAFIIRTEKF